MKKLDEWEANAEEYLKEFEGMPLKMTLCKQEEQILILISIVRKQQEALKREECYLLAAGQSSADPNSPLSVINPVLKEVEEMLK